MQNLSDELWNIFESVAIDRGKTISDGAQEVIIKAYEMIESKYGQDLNQNKLAVIALENAGLVSKIASDLAEASDTSEISEALFTEARDILREETEDQGTSFLC